MSAKTNFWLDAAIFAGFLIAFEPGLTGIAIHEWLSLALAATLLIHLLLHWDWVAKVTIQFFKKLFHSSRLQYVVDVLLLVAMVTVMLSGILISRSILPFLGLSAAAGNTWRFLHSSSADATLLLTALHFALHWKWIVGTAKRLLHQSGQGASRLSRTSRTLQPAAAPVHENVEN